MVANVVLLQKLMSLPDCPKLDKAPVSLSIVDGIVYLKAHIHKED